MGFRNKKSEDLFESVSQTFAIIQWMLIVRNCIERLREIELVRVRQRIAVFRDFHAVENTG